MKLIKYFPIFILGIILLSVNCFALKNPAAVYCNELGYDYKINETEKGQEGLCVISDEVKLQGWDFFKGKVGKEYSYCAKHGYDTKTVKGEAVCVLPKRLATNEKSRKLVQSYATEEIPVAEMMGLEEKLDCKRKPKSTKMHNVYSAPLSKKSMGSSPLSQGTNTSFDWRNHSNENWMTSVKDQGSCGSCWAFCSVGAIETKYNINENNSRLDPDISEEYLVSDCHDVFGYQDCCGGWMEDALNFIKTDGISDESCFSYVSGTNCGCDGDHLCRATCTYRTSSAHPTPIPSNCSDATCSDRCSDYSDRSWRIDGADYSSGWTGFTNEELEEWIIDRGPLVVAIGILGSYGGYFDGDCIYRCSDDSGANHGVILVGYNNTENDATSYWIIKNSWGINYNVCAPDGYFKLGFNECNISGEVHYVNLTNPPNFKPAINIGSPSSDYVTNNSQVQFNFTVINRVATTSICDLIINGTVNQTNSSVNNDTLTTLTTTLPDGNYSWNISCWETGISVANSSETRNIVVDTTYPAVNIVSPQNRFYNTSTISLNYTVQETNLDSCWFTNTSNENQTLSNCENLTITSLGDGQYNITVFANDTAGNVNSSSVNFSVDTTYPTIDYDSLTEANHTNKSQNYIEINVTWTETNFANITWNINGTEYINTTQIYMFNKTNLGDGNYTYYVTVCDNASNCNSTETRLIVLDTTNPQIAFSSGTEANYTNKSQTWIYSNITVSELYVKNVTWNIGGIERIYNSTDYISGGGGGGGGGGVTYIYDHNETNLGDGNYTYYVTSCDYSGNCNSSETMLIVLDTTPPTAVTALSNKSTNDTAVTLNWTTATDTGSGVKEYFIYRNSTYIANTTGTEYNDTGLSGSTYYLYNVSAVDYAGNENSSANITINTSGDVTAPIISNVSNTSITSSAATITWTTNENANSTVYYSTNSSNLNITEESSTKEIAHSIDLSGLSETTTYFYKVGSVDLTGNSANSSIYNFTTSSGGNGGNGGGGGGGGGSSATTTTIVLTKTATQYTKLARNNKLAFASADETHTLTIKKVTSTQTDFMLESDPVEFSLAIGEEKTIDLGSNEELYLRVDSIKNKKVDITLKKIIEEKPLPTIMMPSVVEKKEEKEPVLIEVESEEIETVKKSNKLGGIIILLIIIVGISGYFFLVPKKKKKRRRRLP